jgi:Sap, sulfolipid-1-addressing protein
VPDPSADAGGRVESFAQGIRDVLTYGIGVAVSLLSIIAEILMLLSPRARLNSPVFLVGWMLALSGVSGVVYVLSEQNNAAMSTGTSDTIPLAARKPVLPIS